MGDARYVSMGDPGYDGGGAPCGSTGGIGAELVIERGYSSEEEWIFTGTGTALLTLNGCGLGFTSFYGGQCFECWGSCRVLENGTAECWYGWGGDVNAPDPSQEGGRYLRLDPDGSFLYWYHYSIPYDPDFKIMGKLARIV